MTRSSLRTMSWAPHQRRVGLRSRWPSPQDCGAAASRSEEHTSELQSLPKRRSYDLILKDDKIVFEDYELGTTPATRWASFSMAKSTRLRGRGKQIGRAHV